MRPFPLGPLLDDASGELLLAPRATDRGCSIASLLADLREAEAAQRLVDELGGLPLALTLAGGYLAKSGVTLADYLALLEQESVNHGSLSAELVEGLPVGSRASVAAAFALSYEQLGAGAVDCRARMMWLTAAQLAPEPLAAGVLLRAADLDPTSEEQREQGEVALRRLRELGLIERTDAVYRLHRLLGAYARAVDPDHGTHRRRAAQGLAQTITYLDDEGELGSSVALLRGHVRQLIGNGLDTADADAAALWHAAGLVMYEEEDYGTARGYLVEALAIKEAVLGRQHRETAVTLHALGRVAYQEEDYATARGYLVEALAIKEAVLGRQHRETAITISTRRDLLLDALFLCSLCAGLAWFWLPRPFDLIAAGVLLGLGAIGYGWWGLAMKLVRAVLRMQISGGVVFLLLTQLQRLVGGMTMTIISVTAASGALVGFLWPWLRTRPPVWVVRFWLRRWWRQRTLRSAVRRGETRV